MQKAMHEFSEKNYSYIKKEVSILYKCNSIL